MATQFPHTGHIIVTNPANANQLWGVLWSAKEPGNTANGQTFQAQNGYRDTNTPGPGPDAYIIHTRLTADQKAELELFVGGGLPARWLLEGLTSGQLNTWRSEITVAFDQPSHVDWVAATPYVPVDL